MKRGFTLVEVLVVIVILVILGVIMLGVINGARQFNAENKKPVTEEVLGKVVALKYVALHERWEGKLDEGDKKFCIHSSADDCHKLVAMLRIARMKDYRIQGIIKYQGRLALHGDVLSLSGIDAEGDTFAIETTFRDEDAVREMME